MLKSAFGTHICSASREFLQLNQRKGTISHGKNSELRVKFGAAMCDWLQQIQDTHSAENAKMLLYLKSRKILY